LVEVFRIHYILISAMMVGIQTGQAQVFSEVSTMVGVIHHYQNSMLMGGGAAVFDYDNDRFLDLYLTGGEKGDKLYHNNGDGTFTDVSSFAGISSFDSVWTMGAATGDIDNDGFREIFITTWDGYPNIILKNNGDGTFTDIATAAGITDTALSIAPTFGDVNNDGFTDIYVANYVDQDNSNPQNGFDYTCYANYLYVNNGDETFTDLAATYGVADTGCGLATAFTNYDHEADIDLFIANDFGEWVRPNTLFRNDLPGTGFTDVSLSSGMNDSIYGMGIAIGDYDEDGDFDYYVTNLGRNVLRNNNGNGTFTDLTDTAGVTNTFTDSTLFAVGWGTAFFDYDNDSYLDLIVANGHIPADSAIANSTDNPNVLFKNNGNGTFSDVSDAQGFNDTTRGRGLALGDFDNDGDLDIVVGVVNSDSSSLNPTLIYKNLQVTGNNWVSFSMQGTTSNRDGFGAQITVYAGGRSFIREIDGGSSHLSHSSSLAHFGLGSIASIDSVVILWPDSNLDGIGPISVNQFYHVIEDSSFYAYSYPQITICSNDSLFVGGDYQNTTGIYYDSLSAVGGYDSLVTTTLNVLPASILNNQVTICSNDSALINGNYYNAPGTYVDSFSGVYCDSIIITDLLVNNITFTTIDTNICEGELYNGVTYFSDTVVLDSAIGSNGCDSIFSSNISIIPDYTNVVDTSICEGKLYNGVLYANDTVIIDSMGGINYCDSIITTNLTIINTGISYLSQSVCYGSQPFGYPIYSDTTFVDTLVSTSNCDSVIQTDITVMATYNLSIDTSIVLGELYNGIAYNSDTVIIDSMTTSNGCDSIVTTSLTILPTTFIQESEQSNAFSIAPNPITDIMKIGYYLDRDETVEISILNLLGETLTILISSPHRAGNHYLAWNGTGQNSSFLSNGIYLCRVSVGKKKPLYKLLVLSVQAER